MDWEIAIEKIFMARHEIEKKKKNKEKHWISTKFLCLRKPQKLLLGRRLTVEIVLFFFFFFFFGGKK